MTSPIEELDRAAEKVVTTTGLPPCPAILTVLVRELRNDDPDLNRLARLIGDDLTLAASVLRTVNSPFYGLRTKITSTRHALAMLGLRAVTHLVTGLLLRQAFPAGARAGLDEFWERSSGNAHGCAFIARELKAADSETAHTFALFRDCGIPALMTAVKGYRVERGWPVAGQPVTALEQLQFHTTHALIGSRLARTWYMPEEISAAVLWHHELEPLAEGTAGIAADSVRLIALALAGEELYTRHTGGRSCAEWPEHGVFAMVELGIAEDEFEEIAAEAAAAFEAV